MRNKKRASGGVLVIDRRWLRVASLAMGGVFVSTSLGMLHPAAVGARVDPLNLIARQVQRPNILIVLDTSGSMSGVPGGLFTNATEVGIDCDDGVACRNPSGASVGVCTGTGAECTSSAQCQKGGLCQFNFISCSTDAECGQAPGTCAARPDVPCYADADCPPLGSQGICKSSGAACNTKNKTCTADLRCRYGTTTCSAEGAACPSDGVCQDESGAAGPVPIACSSDGNCPYQTTGGRCQWTPTACGSDADCPQANLAKKCSVAPYADCSSDAECAPAGDGANGCTQAGMKTCADGVTCCTKDANCSKQQRPCDFWRKCAAPTNRCIVPHQACNIVHSDNVCVNANPCLLGVDKCVAPASNPCTPANSAATCQCPVGCIAGSSRMCSSSLKLCSADRQCTSGETCVPATSRMVMAKRVVSQVVQDNYRIANFGLMTYYQSGYYKYYPITGSITTTAATVELRRGRLEGLGCFDKNTGPTPTCSYNGETFVLRSPNNSAYHVPTWGRHGYDTKDADWCGTFCDIPGTGRGIFRAAYYVQSVKTGSSYGPPVTQTQYMGPSYTAGGVTYVYMPISPGYYNEGKAPPIDTPSCTGACGPTCGGRWDSQLTTNLLSPDPALQQKMRDDITQQMQPAALGGLIGYGSTPTGCTLFDDGAQSESRSAYHYLAKVRQGDPVSWEPPPSGCRTTAVVLVTDGEANGPGDTSSSNGGCADASRCGNPAALGQCNCAAVKNADRLYRELNVRTYVVGFSVDAKTGAAAVTNDNIARAGRTDANAAADGTHTGTLPYAFQAGNEAELVDAFQGAVYQTLKGWYATSPASASSGTQQANQVSSGTIVLDSRVKFPSWEGTLLAYDVASGAKLWDAAAIMNTANNNPACGTPPYWATRNVFTSTSDNELLKIRTATTCVGGSNVVSITNLSDLRLLAGLGTSDAETEAMVRWLLGDPASGNPAKLGSIVNSTPIDVAGAGDGTMPGQHAFFNLYKDRKALTYVGADDGMLHAFFTQTTTLGGTTFPGGTEAFAYVAPDMIDHIENLYANRGQPADPTQHLYGQASSPKVKNICVSGCAQESTAIWKTVLVMTEGFGSRGIYALDITSPFSALTEAPFSVLWFSGTLDPATRARLGVDIGLTISVPGFYFNKTDALDDYRVLLASGYPVTEGSVTQGRYLVSLRVRDGALVADDELTNTSRCTERSDGHNHAGQELTVLADVATARDYYKDSLRGVDNYQKLMAAYVGDTWGQLYRYTPDRIEVVKNASGANPFGCDHPLHFAPTVVQLDRDDSNSIHGHESYIVQVTNSSLDPVTQGYPESKMVFLKDTMDAAGVVRSDPSFGTGGVIEFQVGQDDRMCAISDALGNCTTRLPSGARPLGTPMAVVKKDGTGFILISNWWAPPVTNCGQGRTYLLVHDFYPPLVTLRQAVYVADEAISAPVIVGSKILEVGSGGPMDQSGSLSVRVGVGTVQARSAIAGERFRITGWTELP